MLLLSGRCGRGSCLRVMMVRVMLLLLLLLLLPVRSRIVLVRKNVLLLRQHY